MNNFDECCGNLIKTSTLTAGKFTEASGTNPLSSDFVAVHIEQANFFCFIGIDQAFCSNQCLLDFGEG